MITCPGPRRLARWRIKQGMTRAQAADALEVPRSTYSAWERGEWPPRPYQGLRLERLTGVPATAWLAR